MCEPCCTPLCLGISLFTTPSSSCGTHDSTEPTRAGRRDPEPRDAWRLRSPPEQRGGVRSRGTHGGTGPLLSREAVPRAMGHGAAPVPFRTGRPWTLCCGTHDRAWMYALLLCFNLELVRGVPDLQGIDNCLRHAILLRDSVSCYCPVIVSQACPPCQLLT
jgi:hypothetical protein